MQTPKTIHTSGIEGFTWINAVRATEEETLYLEQTQNLHPLDAKECLPPLQRPKLIVRPEYLFMILTFPSFNRRTRELETEEIDLFIKKDSIITMHGGRHQALTNLFELLDMNKPHREELMSNPALFVSQLLDELLDSCFPLLLHISNDIEALTKKTLKGYTKETIHEILRIKTNIVAFRKMLQPHRDLLLRAQSLLPNFFPIERHSHSFQKLIDHCREIWDNLETYNFAIDGLHQTHTTLISFRLNEIMRTLTVFSMVIFTLTLLATLFSIGANSTPFVGSPFGFWYIVALMLAGAWIGIAIFKKKGWL
ncbi:MAG: magnesium transporter CorA family protein [Patescibacteria group bacterium]